MWYVTVLLVGGCIGVVVGQLSVWRYLRKYKKTVINGWEYKAKEVKDGEVT